MRNALLSSVASPGLGRIWPMQRLRPWTASGRRVPYRSRLPLGNHRQITFLCLGTCVPGILGVTAVESRKAVKATFWARLIRKARHGAQASGTGGSTPLPPEPPRRMGVFGGTRRLSRRRTNEQASHDEGLVKGSHHGDIETSPVASVSKVQAHSRDAARFRARSTSHAVAAH